MKYAVLVPGLLFAVILAAQRPAVGHTPVAVYLTFDDGPMKASHHLVNVIQRDSIPVTVFLVGQQVYKSPDNRDIFQWYRSNPFVMVANHSFSHAGGKYRWYYRHPSSVMKDILCNEDTLGIDGQIVRLPGRNAWRVNGRHRNDLPDAVAACDSLAAAGYTIFGWDLEWCYDTSGHNYTANIMLRQLRALAKHGGSFVRDHIVILCHDPMLLDDQIRDEFEDFIRTVKADNTFVFRTLASFPGYRKAAPGF